MAVLYGGFSEKLLFISPDQNCLLNTTLLATNDECVVSENIHTPKEGKGNSECRGIQKEAISEEVGVASGDFFPGGPSKINRQAISYLLIGASKQKLLFIVCSRLSAFFTACTIVCVAGLSSAHE